jgi:NodT family efflux transporter outer membrane factor (OMF) lipoprotein
MVGPNFHPPVAPNAATYTGSPKSTKTVSIPLAGQSGKSQHFLSGRDIPGDWWKLFHSPELNDLILKGIAHSPTLASAEAALRQAQELFYAQFASTLIPNVNGQLSAVRQKFADSSIGFGQQGALFNLYNVSASVSYNLDVFGGSRRALEGLCSQINYQHYQLEAAYLTLTANIVTTTITIASLRAQIDATKYLIKSQADQLDIIQKQYKFGAISEADVLTQLAQVAQTAATLPPLEKALAQNLHALSVLIGEIPDEQKIPKLFLKRINLPRNLPISIPSRLVQQRPDIKASQALLHVASAQVGVATANLYPQITINGNDGWEGNFIPQLFKPESHIWSIGGSLLQPLFNAGALRARRRAAIDAYEQAYAQYQQVVLLSFKNVADVLRALEQDAKQLRAQKEAEVAAQRSLNLTQQQYKLGGANYLSLLVTQRQYQQALISRIQVETLRYNDTAALFQALGGGWWNRTKAMIGQDNKKSYTQCSSRS